jgi:hypothetical protein
MVRLASLCPIHAAITPAGTPCGISGVGCLAGRLEDNATPNLNRVVGEPFVKPAQQRNIYGGLHAVRPFPFFEQSEQVLVKFVDDFIVTADLRCPFGITR